MNPVFAWKWMRAAPVVGILRNLSGGNLEPVLNAVFSGGLRNLEITMNSFGAADQIRRAVEMFGSQMNIGAGTVTTTALLDEALDAGAGFIVTPYVQEEVIRTCVDKKVPVFPGAFSPTEIQHAWALGAGLVKVFPAELNGPGYIRSLKGPFPEIALMPTGGVDLETIGGFVRAGAEAFGIGSPLFRPEKIAAGDWDWLRTRCAALIRGSQPAV